jgi:predicted extracellular nuclease
MLRSRFVFIIFVFISLTFLSTKCETDKDNTPLKKFQIAFYNVENLFDTINDPSINDEDFLPTSKKEWNSKKYFEKLKNLAAVIDSLKPGLLAPEIVGLCEVENKTVVEDLINQPNLKANNYKIAHFDSPDARGIDVACLYNSNLFSLKSSRKISIINDLDTNFKTRDILFCEFIHTISNTTFYVYVNHWSSRRGGEAESSHKRELCALFLKNDIEKNIPDYQNQSIIMIGDMNDHPTNKSMYEVLEAKEPSQLAYLTNLMYTKHENKEGTYFYKGDWGVIDNIIVSKSVLKHTSESNAVIYKKDWLLYTTSSGDKAPSRSYSGDKYYSGYSDHLPVYLELNVK